MTNVTVAHMQRQLFLAWELLIKGCAKRLVGKGKEKSHFLTS